MRYASALLFLLLALVLVALGCNDSSGRAQVAAAESCMTCHNGSQDDDYSGPGLENPHPFATADNLRCTSCHGGNGRGGDKDGSHVPPPPEIGDRQNLENDPHAYFNRLTLAGIDKFPDYQVNGRTYSAIDYLQFINPGDLRVVTQSRSCGQCHDAHADAVASSPLATSTGIFSGAMYAIGAENAVPESVDLHRDTAADLSFRAVSDPHYAPDPAKVGHVARLLEVPVHSVAGRTGPSDISRNREYAVAALEDDIGPDNRVVTGSPLAHLFNEQVSFTCGDCHLGSAGANNRAGDYRSSGCTPCHMPYSLGGRSGSRDPNVSKLEPIDPDDIDAPERSHVRAHRIASVAKSLPNGQSIQGIDDHACAGCHQGSNRTVMQYWGIRLDQNADLRNRVQYPANPVAFRNTSRDARLFDPAVGNHTFNGRNANQYILFEDYDGDGRDDTPADVHYEAGLGCIDCHGSHDLHGGDVSSPAGSPIASRMEQAVSIRREDCHGTIDTYAPTVPGTTYDGRAADLAVDSKGNPLKHVVREADGSYTLTSRLTGARHFVPQTKDTIADSGRLHPATGQPVYNPKASFAMGRLDGNPATGMGPKQSSCEYNGFSHTDRMNCVACHASWTNTCMGCHLGGEYNTGNNFSNITGERIVFRQANADFVYQSPIYFQLGVGPDDKITQFSANTKVFFQYRDIDRQDSRIFSFTDRNGGGNDRSKTPYPSLSHNAIMAHSIRGRVTATDEGPRYCASCHLTTDGLASYRPQYDSFRAAMNSNAFGQLDFPLLRTHFGLNTGNQMNSPFFAHMAAGLGTGLFLFDENGCPVNPLDGNVNRVGCDGIAPASVFAPLRAAFNLDRIVEPSGLSNGSSNHAFRRPGPVDPALRDGAADPELAGPLGATLVRRLTDPDTGIVLDSWIDADGAAHGGAPGPPPAPRR